MRLLLVVLCYAGMFICAGCDSEPSYESGTLTGHWEVYAADRDGRNTTLLNKAVFSFQEDNSMKTNITGTENIGSYVVDKNMILFNGDSGMSFEITNLSGDSMSLKTQLQGMQFLLDLRRTTTESR